MERTKEKKRGRPQKPKGQEKSQTTKAKRARKEADHKSQKDNKKRQNTKPGCLFVEQGRASSHLARARQNCHLEEEGRDMKG